MNCLVTGGAGFIGSHLVEALVRRGNKVKVCDNLRTGTLANLVSVQKDIEFIDSDLHDFRSLYETTKGVQVVFHLAVPPEAPYAATDIIHPKWVYVPELLNVLIAARVAKVHRVVFSSCASVYGRYRTQKVAETHPLLPITSHGLSKLAGEQHCLGYTVLHGVETVCLRYFTAYGPRQHPDTPHGQMLNAILKAMLAGEAPVLEQSGGQDLVHVDDVVHATMLAAEAPRVSGKVFNVGSGQPVTPAEVVRVANELLGTRLTPIFKGSATHHLPSHYADVTRAETELGYCPVVDLRRALRHLIEFQVKQGELQYTQPMGDLRQDRPHPTLPKARTPGESKTPTTGEP
jgi:UDP-glucose 4-epimerase